MITGTGDFQQMFQNELWEVTRVLTDDKNYIMPIVKLSDDSIGGLYIVSGSISSESDGMVSVLNSFEGTLSANQVFSGTFENVVPYGGIRISVHTTAQSATGGLQMWCSKDGTNGFAEDSYTIVANTPKTYAVPIAAPYFRVIFRNGSSQANVNICVIYQKNVSIPSSHRIGDNVTSDDDAQLVQAVLKAQRPGGDYTNIDATNSGNLKVSIEEIDPSALPISVTLATGSVGTINTSFSDSLYLSEFSELRTANPGNRSDTEFLYDAQPLLYDSIVVSGSVTFQTGTRDLVLETIGYSGTYSATHRKRYWIPYTPGSGQETDLTGVLNMANASGEASVFLRSSVSGTTSVERIPQSQWIAETTGISWNNSQIFRMSFQSLKVGRIQYALVRNGLPIKVAQITNDNERSMGYWQYASLPPYWSVYHVSSGTISEIGYGDNYNGIGFSFFTNPNPNQKVRAICETVKSQGGQSLLDMPGYPFSYGRKAASISVATTIIPIVSIRVAALLNGLTNRAVVIPTGFDLQSDNPIYYQIIYRPTLTGASWVTINSQSGVEGDISASAISGGYIIDEGYISTSRNLSTGESGLLGRTVMALGSLGVSDIVSLAAVRTTSNSATVFASLKWKEIR